MAYRGKIACYFPEHNPQNYNVDDIEFLPVGGGENDLLYIDKVYALPVGASVSSVSDLEQYIVWGKLVNMLLAGDRSVAIQYTPTTNISVTDIGIFTASNDNNDAKIKVFHESGLCVAAYDGDVRTRNSELYGLSGTKRDGSVPTTTLYAGQKYFIVYYVWGVYPAYYQNSDSQSIANKVYENNTAASQMTIYDISESATVLKPSMFRGVMSDSMGIFAFTEDSWFVWMGSTQTGMTQAQIYRRTNVGAGWNFVGIVGDPNNPHQITAEDLQAIISKPPNGDFIWYVDNVTGMNRNEVWGKPLTWVTHPLVDISNDNDEYVKLARILMSLTDSTSKVMISDGNLLWTYGIGDVISLKSGYSSKVSSTTPLSSLPSNPSTGEIYYLSGSIGQAVLYQTSIFAYNGNSYTQITQADFTTYFNVDGLSTLLEKIGTNSDLLEAVSNTKGDESLLNANTDDRKYYLKVNGNEV